jgi:hypothetical protein
MANPTHLLTHCPHACLYVRMRTVHPHMRSIPVPTSNFYTHAPSSYCFRKHRLISPLSWPHNPYRSRSKLSDLPRPIIISRPSHTHYSPTILRCHYLPSQPCIYNVSTLCICTASLTLCICTGKRFYQRILYSN